MRCSVTELDTFRRWRQDEEADLDALLRRLRKEEPPTEAMLAGIALHKALELAQPGTELALEQDGYRFEFAADVELALSPFREIKTEKVYMVNGYPVTVSAVVDHLVGRRIEDHKTTSRFDAERFLESYQWRFYLDIFGADEFAWNVFEMAEQVEPKAYKVYAFHQLRQFRYPAMRDDCLALLGDFLAFARQHLPERFERAAA